MQEESKSAAPAASGWGADFLKSNVAAQASQSEAIAKEIADKKSGSTAPSLPSFGKPFSAPGKDAESESAPSRPEPVSLSPTQRRFPLMKDAISMLGFAFAKLERCNGLDLVPSCEGP